MTRDELAELVAFQPPVTAPLETVESHRRDGYAERLVRYADVPAYLLTPAGEGPFPAVAAFHQHNSEWHLGKSEVAGLAGDPLQAFGPALARRGVVVLAPDAIAFEDRRRAAGDGLGHFNEMAYRLLEGRLLATDVLADAARAVSVLAGLEEVDGGRIGALGHSYGGSTAIFLAALDERVRFACSSGAACTYRRRIADGTGIELAQLIPGILRAGDLDDVVALIAPRPLLLVSATSDPYSADADEIEGRVAHGWAALEHARYDGSHALTSERFERIVDWVASRAAHYDPAQ